MNENKEEEQDDGIPQLDNQVIVSSKETIQLLTLTYFGLNKIPTI
jgi:hypothetical protein